MAAELLGKYRSSDIRHPSWRIYKALADIKNNLPELKEKKIFDPDELDNLDPGTFGLKTDITVYFPYQENDELTNEIIASIINPDYTDKGKFGIEECMSLFCDIDNRQLLECMLMEDYSITDISLNLGYSENMVQTYAAAFFDTSVWRSNSDKLVYLKRGTAGKDSSVKNKVNINGLDYVATVYYHKPHKVRMEKALADVFGRGYEKVIENIGSDEELDQATAQKWAGKLIDIFKELKNASKADGGIKELSIALRTESAPTIGIEDLDKDEQIEKHKE